MPADEVPHGTGADVSRARTGPLHAAPRKPLFTRFHSPAGKAIALAAMPTAVFMGMGLNSTLARADDHTPARSLTAEEYQKCVEVLDNSTGSKGASSRPTPSASGSAASSASSASAARASKSADTAEPTPSASASAEGTSGRTSSSDSGSGAKAMPTPSASASSSLAPSSDSSPSSRTSPPSPSASARGGGLLGAVGNTVTGVLTGGSGVSASASPTRSASAPAPATRNTSQRQTVTDTTRTVTDTVTGTVKDTVKDIVKDTTDTPDAADTPDTPDTTDTPAKAVSEAPEPAGGAVKPTASAPASTSPSPSASSTASAKDCPAATDDQGGVENIVALPDRPWHLQASSLLLKGADYQGVVKVRTADGTVKRVLKYVISGGTDIGDLHQVVQGQNGETYHLQAAKGSMSTIRDGTTVMYTESISGDLFGLIPTTFSPDNPPPLNIPLIYFTNVKVTQAGQFGGTLHVPGMHSYITGAS